MYLFHAPFLQCGATRNSQALVRLQRLGQFLWALHLGQEDSQCSAVLKSGASSLCHIRQHWVARIPQEDHGGFFVVPLLQLVDYENVRST